MRTPQRRIDPGVIRRLLRQPHRYEFFQAVRLLEQLFARRGNGAPEHALATRVSFRNTLALSFPPSELQAIEAGRVTPDMLESDAAFIAALEDGALDTVAITPTFFGLLGVQGALPLRYTEIVAEREAVWRDRAARAFFDIFSNRATALFYQAWKKYRLPFQYEVDNDRHYLPLLLSLAGAADKTLRHDLSGTPGPVHDEALAGYATAIRHRPVSAAYLQRVLADYFQAPMRVEQFVGNWYRVPPSQYSRLGGTNNVLGATALAGARVWQRDLRVRVWVGPMARKQYRNFLPGAPGALALRKMLIILCGATLEFEIKLILRREDVAGCTLGAQDSGRSAGRLGWDTFLCSRPAQHDRSDAQYTLAPLH
ncbi:MULTISPECIES: type VI secretion system baseplate subunit TssG [Ralstonia solanacearum species complex]|uniref:type VI secretion system baseplate subunit TssG n=1 Tax=Ralstonia solanacearum species complex TaxID=3116862 RepID=UPI000E59451A|nr:type VI secretion system baseplate subunit TssG [Ralstonia solanacearum]BEU74271.1 type VI secretion system baseplate subunit TssG [Ralstonia pseudosolanacearum]AXV79151.1 type VI secretion protein [Ralstonia solanacearum]AXV93173.1 type VI secretion protein [Ralstonia solanacearum]AXW21222.1 type VI secretion protein [Ralstonia solanacearum]AXW78069.1 type VI secretion protein [Ralstonia solanacearum]